MITDEIRMSAMSSVQTGEVVSVNAELGIIDPPIFGREPLQQSIEIKREGLLLDDRIDAFYPQVSSQWDALNHVGADPGVFFGGRSLDEQQSEKLNGIDVWARSGIVGRGVLLDLEPVLRDQDPDFDPGSATPISVADLGRALDEQNVSLQFGDILVLNVGYLSWYKNLGYDRRVELSRAGGEVKAVGLEHSEQMARFLWDSGVCAIAADFLGVEMWPPDRTAEARPFGFLHSMLIGHFGMAIGELWELDTLLSRCRERNRWDFLLVSAPMNLPGGIGSPSNALAIL